MTKCLIVAISFIAGITNASITNDKGYWNYEINIKASPTVTVKDIQKMPSTKKLIAMHPDQIKQLIADWRRQAIYTLKPADVSEYLRIQDVARKKAVAFSAVVAYVNQTNPNLSLADEIPITNSGNQERFNKKERDIDNYLSRINKDYGLLYWTSNTCQYCRLQDATLKRLLESAPFDIKSMSLKKNPILAQQFNIRQVPSIVLVHRKTKEYFPVSFGATSLPVLKENIYRGARFLNKEINPRQFFTNEQDINTGLDPDVDR